MDPSSDAEEIGRSLLEAMDAENPFKLLRSFPDRFSDLSAVMARRDGVQVGHVRVQNDLSQLTESQRSIVNELVHVQSQGFEAINSCQCTFGCSLRD